MRSDEVEADVLAEQVFLPAVRAFEALAPEPTPDPATLGYDVVPIAAQGVDPTRQHSRRQASASLFNATYLSP